MSVNKQIVIIEDDWKHFQVFKSLLLDIDCSYSIFPLCNNKTDFLKFNARLIRSLDSTKKNFQADKSAFTKELSDFGEISLYVIDQVLQPDNTTLTGTCFYNQNSIVVPSLFLTISTQAAVSHEIRRITGRNPLRKPEEWEGRNKTVQEIKQVDIAFNELFKTEVKELLGITEEKKKNEEEILSNSPE